MWNPNGLALTIVPPPPPMRGGSTARLELLEHVLEGEDVTTVYHVLPNPPRTERPFARTP